MILNADCNDALLAPGSDCETSKALFSDIELSSSSGPSYSCSFFDAGVVSSSSIEAVDSMVLFSPGAVSGIVVMLADCLF